MAMTDSAQRWDDLRAVARAASKQAYSPYSGLQVGAVVVDEEGNRYAGCNVENASYGLTQCAERNALATAVAAGAKPGTLQTLLVYSTGFEMLSPCGACRQVMNELLAADATVVSCCADDAVRTWSLGDLFPYPFVLE
jgi:cytidine deaminase